MISLTRSLPYRVVINNRHTVRFRTDWAAAGYADQQWQADAKVIRIYNGRELVGMRRRAA